MRNKENLLKIIDQLPEDFSIEKYIERFILLEKIKLEREKSKLGNTFSTDETREKLKKKLK